MKNNILPIIIIFLLILFAYYRLPDIYFQQDEWIGFGQVLTNSLATSLSRYSFLDMLAAKDRLIGLPFNYLLFLLSPFHVLPYAIFSYIFHTINSCLVYVFIKKMLKSKLFGLLGGIFFAISFVPSQAVTWFAAVTTTLPTTTCILLSLIFTLVYAEKKRLRYIYIAQIFGVLSFLFKESSLLLVLCLPLFYLLITGKYKSMKHFGILIGYSLFVISTKVSFFLSPSGRVGSYVSQEQYVYVKILIHAILYPILSLSQVFIAPLIMYKTASQFQSVFYDFLRTNVLSEAIAENVVADLLALLFSFGLLCLFLVIVTTQKKLRKATAVGLGLVIFSILPFIVITRGTSYLDSRYYYTCAIGVSLLSAVILQYIINIFSNKRILQLFVISIIFFISGIYITKNIQFIHRELNQQAIIGQERRKILNTITALYPSLPRNPVIYITGSKKDYYGVSGLSIPFQQGPGYTLMVWYYPTGTIPSELVRGWYLYDLHSQGYEEVNGKGFGFYNNMDLLKQDIDKKFIHPNQVIAFYYDDQNKTITDITQKIRLTL